MSQSFTTEIIPAADRLDAWRSNAQQICGDCRIKLPKTSFHGNIEVRSVGGLNLTRFSSSPLSFWKWPPDMLREENRSCIVITQLSGVRQYLQNGHGVLLGPGDSTMIDSGRPWCSTCSTDCTRLYLRVPRWMMENYLRTREIPITERISGTRLGATLCRLAQSLYDEADYMTDQEGAAALNAYFGTLAACLGRNCLIPPDEARLHFGRRSGELLERIRQFIEAHLSESTMMPAEIASALGISTRHLHRSFSDSGNSVGGYIRSRRLQECRKDLVNPRMRDKSITEIAFFWGFSDSAHFSRSFSKQFGTSPRDFRSRALEKQIYYINESLPKSLLEGSQLHYTRAN